MSLLDLVGLNDILNRRALNVTEQTHYDESLDDGKIKISLPMQSYTDKITLPNVTDAVTEKEIAIKFNKGTTTIGFVYQGGIVICADSRATGGQFIGSSSVEKIIPITDHLVGTMAGGAADCIYWERVLSERCRLYELKNRERISVAAASKLLANMLYNYKGMGLSMGVMIAGHDHKKGPKLYFIDNDARRLPGNLFSIGSGSVYAYGVLDKGHRYDMSDEEAFDLGRRAIFHATHRDAYSGGTVRIVSMKQDGWRFVSEDDMMSLYDRFSQEGSISTDH